jgi:hypothetical protein
MAGVAYSITVDEAHLGATRAIARRLGECGLVVDRVVAAAGAIRAFGEPGAADAARGIEGVAEVKPEATFALPRRSRRIPT